MAAGIRIGNCDYRNVLCIGLSGKLDCDTAYHMLRSMKGQPLAQCNEIYLDMRDVSEIGSPALGALLLVNDRFGRSVERIRLYCMDGDVQQLLHIAGIDRVFAMHVQAVNAGCMDGGPCQGRHCAEALLP